VFTVSSAGGRRGAQMDIFDIFHPDVKSFILAKREDGRLRQFNLSLLNSDKFIEAVKNQTRVVTDFSYLQKRTTS
jgi:ribonucleoside-diphosphate reductase alpha chain